MPSYVYIAVDAEGDADRAGPIPRPMAFASKRLAEEWEEVHRGWAAHPERVPLIMSHDELDAARSSAEGRVLTEIASARARLKDLEDAMARFRGQARPL